MRAHCCRAQRCAAMSRARCACSAITCIRRAREKNQYRDRERGRRQRPRQRQSSFLTYQAPCSAARTLASVTDASGVGGVGGGGGGRSEGSGQGHARQASSDGSSASGRRGQSIGATYIDAQLEELRNMQVTDCMRARRRGEGRGGVELDWRAHGVIYLRVCSFVYVLLCFPVSISRLLAPCAPSSPARVTDSVPLLL